MVDLEHIQQGWGVKYFYLCLRTIFQYLYSGFLNNQCYILILSTVKYCA